MVEKKKRISAESTFSTPLRSRSGNWGSAKCRKSRNGSTSACLCRTQEGEKRYRHARVTTTHPSPLTKLHVPPSTRGWMDGWTDTLPWKRFFSSDFFSARRGRQAREIHVAIIIIVYVGTCTYMYLSLPISYLVPYRYMYLSRTWLALGQLIALLIANGYMWVVCSWNFFVCIIIFDPMKLLLIDSTHTLHTHTRATYTLLWVFPLFVLFREGRGRGGGAFAISP